jgi:siroheme synthase
MPLTHEGHLPKLALTREGHFTSYPQWEEQVTDTLKVVLALQAEGMPEAQAAIIANELYALYRVAILGSKYKPVEYPLLGTLREKIDKLKKS